jgi:thioredoxin-like negative regulator of GroEL
MERVQGPCEFKRLYARPPAEKAYFDITPDSCEANLRQGEQWARQGNAKRALPAYLNAWWLRKDRACGLRLLELLRGQGRSDAALQVVRTLATLYPSDKAIFREYARALDEAGFPAEAASLRQRLAQTR